MAIWNLAQLIQDREAALNIKSRRVWNAQPMENPRARIKPAKHVFCGYSRKLNHNKSGPNNEQTSFDIVGELQYTQCGDMERKEPDIRYKVEMEIVDDFGHNELSSYYFPVDENLDIFRYCFMIGADEIIYEGRGWSHCATLPRYFRYYTLEAIYIGYIGDFKDEGPSPRMFELRDELIWVGVMRKFISPLFTLWQLAWPSTINSDFKKYITI